MASWFSWSALLSSLVSLPSLLLLLFLCLCLRWLSPSSLSCLLLLLLLKGQKKDEIGKGTGGNGGRDFRKGKRRTRTKTNKERQEKQKWSDLHAPHMTPHTEGCLWKWRSKCFAISPTANSITAAFHVCSLAASVYVSGAELWREWLQNDVKVTLNATWLFQTAVAF